MFRYPANLFFNRFDTQIIDFIKKNRCPGLNSYINGLQDTPLKAIHKSSVFYAMESRCYSTLPLMQWHWLLYIVQHKFQIWHTLNGITGDITDIKISNNFTLRIIELYAINSQKTHAFFENINNPINNNNSDYFEYWKITTTKLGYSLSLLS